MTMFLFSGFSFFHLVSFLYPHRHGNPSSFRCIPRKLPRYCPSAWCWFCVDIRLSSIVVESIVPEFGFIQEIRDGLGKSWILPCVTFAEHFWMNIKVFQAQWCILSIFMIKRNTCFQVAVLIVNPTAIGLWCLSDRVTEKSWCSRFFDSLSNWNWLNPFNPRSHK